MSPICKPRYRNIRSVNLLLPWKNSVSLVITILLLLQAFEAEVSAHSNAIVSLDNVGHEMIGQGHYASETIRKRLEELHKLWELLLQRLAEKGLKLQQALVLVQFVRSVDEVLLWISDKEAFVTADEFGTDLEHVEVLQRKFDEFQKDMASEEYRVNDVNIQAEKLSEHPEADVVFRKRDVRCLGTTVFYLIN